VQDELSNPEFENRLRQIYLKTLTQIRWVAHVSYVPSDYTSHCSPHTRTASIHQSYTFVIENLSHEGSPKTQLVHFPYGGSTAVGGPQSMPCEDSSMPCEESAAGRLVGPYGAAGSQPTYLQCEYTDIMESRPMYDWVDIPTPELGLASSIGGWAALAGYKECGERRQRRNSF
jgi:hypothetical protein